MVKRYKKSTHRRRRRSKKRPRRRRKKISSVWKTAVRAARTVVKKKAAPLFTRLTFADYDPQTGQFSNLINVAAGPDNGHIQPLVVRTSIPANINSVGNPSTRRDQEITITGISVNFRFILPQNQSMAKVKVYLFMDKQYAERAATANPLYATQFMCPDEYFMLRNENDLRSQMQDIKVLTRRSYMIRSNPNSSGNNQSRTFRDVKLWWKPRKGGLKYKYVGPDNDDLLNRSIGVCIKASYPANVAADTMQFGGVITTYYRDYS